MSKEAIEKVIADYFAAIGAMNVDAWVQTFAPDAISYDPAHSPGAQGHEALRQFFNAVGGAFDSINFTVESSFICGQSAAVKWRGQGVGKNGRKVAFEGIDLFEVNSTGKIQRMWGYWDPAAMMAELQG